MQAQSFRIYQKKIKCSIHEITDMKEHPKNLSVEEILVRSSNVGSVLLAKKLVKKILKNLLKILNLQKTLKLN